MKKITTYVLMVLLLCSLTACSVVRSSSSIGAMLASEEIPSSADSTVSQATSVTGAVSVTDALAQNSETHEDPDDSVWDATSVIPILLNGNSIHVEGEGVSVDGSRATITSAGDYSLSGSLVDGQIIVDTQDKGLVRLVLDGVDISNSTSSAIYIKSAKETIIILADGTRNTLSDAGAYVFEDTQADEPNAALFSTSDLTIYGNGSLSVIGNTNDGIASKDGLILAGGEITVVALDDGIRGKDYLVIKSGAITVNAQGDGLKSDNAEDAGRGFISIEAGQINITAEGDAIEAETDVAIADGDFTIISGGGSQARLDQDTSGKGIKAAVSVTIDGGSFNIDAADEAIHSNGSIDINGGDFVISTGDDGLHADDSLTINGGDIRITKSFEGLESALITINGGNFEIIASDDGINVAGGMDGSGRIPGMGGRQMPGGSPGQDFFAATGDYTLYINGGTIVIEAGGDGIDVNGAIEMTGGIVLVNGPTETMNGALDYDRYFNISGGFFVAVGSAGMAQAPSESSSQVSMLVNLNGTQPAGTLVHIQTSAGAEALTFSPTKPYQSIVFSSPALKQGETYDIYLGGNSSGEEADGLYQGGSYSPGARYTSLTISSMVTSYGSGFGGGFGGNTRPGGGRP